MRNRFSTWRAIPRDAFTLIELLIVVAIIAILAAIAVPNFLEAQTRSKVSRVQADFRTLATAIESYFVDKNSYPWDQDDDITSSGEDGFRLLTTPISYFSSGRALSDPFGDPRKNTNDYAAHYQMASGVDPARRSPGRTDISLPQYQPIQAYALFSSGPSYTGQLDPTNDGATGAVMANDDWPFQPLGATGTGLKHVNGCRGFYDPTNGTTSFGGIFRFGGDYNGGNWVIYLGDQTTTVHHDAWGVKTSYP
jgi:prepilin-type N-terminal cleavage/methylation domain-containing protein